jgi:hypothetical protein
MSTESTALILVFVKVITKAGRKKRYMHGFIGYMIMTGMPELGIEIQDESHMYISV